MAVQLFEHNAKAYQAAVKMMQQYGKAAIVHPTGTGKSYIAFKLIEDHSDAVIVWLSPSEYIFKTQRESLLRQDPDFPLQNVRFYTYAKLTCCTPRSCRKSLRRTPLILYSMSSTVQVPSIGAAARKGCWRCVHGQSCWD